MSSLNPGPQMVSYGPAVSLKEALHTYFADNGFGEDGGYRARWVDFKLGPIPFPFPNTEPRRRAVRYHDLHHIVTGYATDLIGEFEISAWEIGSGCRSYVAAWQLNLSGMGAGLLSAPTRTFRAFRRGRRSDNFYGRAYDAALLDTLVGDARESLRVDVEPTSSGVAFDIALFAVASFVGVVMGLALFVVMVPMALVAWPALCLARRRAERAGSAHATQSTVQGARNEI